MTNSTSMPKEHREPRGDIVKTIRRFFSFKGYTLKEVLLVLAVVVGAIMAEPGIERIHDFLFVR